jgi:predicted permease
LERELQAHLDLDAEERIEAGFAPEEARHAARRAFGNVVRVKEEIHEMSKWAPLEQVFQDMRYAVRTLGRAPAFTAVTTLSLALGIGANAAMFSVVDRVLLRPLRYPEAERLVRVTGYYPKGAVAALQERSRALEVAGFTTGSDFNLTGRKEAQRLRGSAVSANLFGLLGVRAALGRTFEAGEDRPGVNDLTLLSHSLWAGEFGRDPGVVGRVVRVDGRDRRVVGVMPDGFDFPVPGTQLWTPLELDASNASDYWGAGFMPLVAKMRPGVTPQQAQAEVRAHNAEIVGVFPFPMPADWNADAAVVALQSALVAGARGRLLLLLGAVGLVLLIACVNVAGLLLARGTVRRKEMALRAALGAGRARMVRQLLTESVVLALLGGALGLALAFGAFQVLRSLLPLDVPGLTDAALDGRILSVVTGLALATGLAFGIVPALTASRLDLAQVVRSGRQRSSDRSVLGLRRALIVGEIGLAVVLVIAAGLLVRSLWALTQVDPGFRPAGILTVRLSPSESSCRERRPCVAFYDEVIRRARGISGVSAVAAVNMLPLGGDVAAVPVEIEGHAWDPTHAVAPLLGAAAVTPGYFDTLGIPVLQGRAFADSDAESSAGVVVVSASTARRHWPGQSPIGKHVRVAWDSEWRSVVGVAADVRHYDLAGRSPAWLDGTLYMPYPQSVTTTRQMPAAMNLLVRADGSAADVAREVRDLVRSVNPDVPVADARPLQAVVASASTPTRSLMRLFVAFGGIALLLAAIGIYGVVSYSTAQRTHEIGVRIALGATQAHVYGMVLGASLRLALAGLVLGALVAVALTRLLGALLYEVKATDPATFFAVGVLLVATAGLAGLVPARRAAVIDPLKALRVD